MQPNNYFKLIGIVLLIFNVISLVMFSEKQLGKAMRYFLLFIFSLIFMILGSYSQKDLSTAFMISSLVMLAEAMIEFIGIISNTENKEN